MNKLKIKPSLAGTLIIALGIIVIILAVLFFTVDPTKNNDVQKNLDIITN